MISIIKIIILSFLGAVGIKHFNEELFEDFTQNPIQYFTSIATGTVSYLTMSSPSTDLISSELIKSIFSIFNAIIIFLLIFICKKVAEPIWEQKIKVIVYRWLNLKK